MDLKDFLPFYTQRVGSFWLLWGINTTVAIAVIGWLISQRNSAFGKQLKLVTTIAYSIFFVVMCVAFVDVGRDLYLIRKDLLYLSNQSEQSNQPYLSNQSEQSNQPFSTKGYIKKKLLNVGNTYYYRGILFSIATCTSFFIFILYLIWSNCLWTLPKTTEMAKKTKMDKDDISTNRHT